MDLMINKMNNNPQKNNLTDLHTHILPSFDDGADSIETALRMLQKQKRNGIERIALTPHFYPMNETLDSFLDRRQQAYASLLACWDGEIMPEMRLGAEVCYTPALLQMDLQRLTIGEGRYLLLELPDFGVAACVDQVVAEVLNRGITPILAHVERCLVFRSEPNQLFDLVKMGALAQIDARALVGRKKDKFAIMCLNKGLAHVIASDVHDLADRDFCIADIATGQNTEMLSRAERFARSIWDDVLPPDFDMASVRKGIFGYY